MLLENHNTQNRSFLFNKQHKAHREMIAKASYEGLIRISIPPSLKFHPSTSTPNHHQLLIPKQTIIIQKAFHLIEVKKHHLITFILNQRNTLSSRISQFLIKTHACLSIKRSLIINRIIILRTYSVTLIQNRYRTFKTRSHFNQMLHNNNGFNVLFLYTLEHSKGNSIAVCVKRETIPMQYSKYLQCYYLQIKRKVMKRSIKVSFIINGNKIIDSRYEVVNDGKGNYFNVIPSSLLYRRVKDRSPKYYKRIVNQTCGSGSGIGIGNEGKYYEKLFECKRKKSIDCYSNVSDVSDMSTELNQNMLWSSYSASVYKKNAIEVTKKPQSILKHRKGYVNVTGINNVNDFKKKSVSFNNMIEVSY